MLWAYDFKVSKSIPFFINFASASSNMMPFSAAIVLSNSTCLSIMYIIFFSMSKPGVNRGLVMLYLYFQLVQGVCHLGFVARPALHLVPQREQLISYLPS